MSFLRNVGLTFAVIILLAAGGCRATGGGVHVQSGQPRVVTAKPGPPPHAPAHGHRAKHQYRYYPQEQVYFDPARQVFFYLHGPNWHMSASLPALLQVTHSHFVTIEVEHQQPYVDFERHQKKYPKKKAEKNRKNKKYEYNGGGQPAVVLSPAGPPQDYRPQHQYRYYPQEQVYFDPGRQVFFYLNGPNWHMGASLPASLQVTHSHFVTVEVEHQQPYLEFEKHKTQYSKKEKDKGKDKGKDKSKGRDR
jgi:hypothetical protein